MPFRRSKGAPSLLVLLLALLLPEAALAQDVTVGAQIFVHHVHAKTAHTGNEDVVVWLTPLNPGVQPQPAMTRHYRITQKDKQFHPHVLAIPVGTSVEFPNLDPWFHNVFSLYKGQRFDLGLYEAGTSRTVKFDKLGVSFIFCNIHPEMSAYVLTLTTPYFAVSDERGQIKIPDVPPGRYRVGFWYERGESAEVANLSREITVADSDVSLGEINIKESPVTIPPHPDKHGQSYTTDHVPY